MRVPVDLPGAVAVDAAQVSGSQEVGEELGVRRVGAGFLEEVGGEFAQDSGWDADAFGRWSVSHSGSLVGVKKRIIYGVEPRRVKKPQRVST